MLCYRCGSYTPDESPRCGECGQPIAQRRRPPRNLSGATDDKSFAIQPFEAGQIIAGRYRIVGPAGAGTTGWVMRARDEETDIHVGLKLVGADLLQTESERSGFLETVEKTRKLHHANVVRICDQGRDGAYVYYTMPFLEGLNLRKVIDLRIEKGAAFTSAEILPLFAQLSEALDAMAELGPHGALRPHNLMVLPDVLKVTAVPHFGGLPRLPFIALQSRADALEYLAPEARREGVAVDRSADVYSIAVIVGEMLTGTIWGRDSKAWERLQDALPRTVAVALRRALAESPARRCATLAELVEALAAAAAEDPPTARPEQRPVLDVVANGSALPPEPTLLAEDAGRPVAQPGKADLQAPESRTIPASRAKPHLAPPPVAPPLGRETPLPAPPSAFVHPAGRETPLPAPPSAVVHPAGRETPLPAPPSAVVHPAGRETPLPVPPSAVVHPPGRETPLPTPPSPAAPPVGRPTPLAASQSPAAHKTARRKPFRVGVHRRSRQSRRPARRRGTSRGSWLLRSIVAILVIGIAVCVAVWLRHRPTIPDLKPVPDSSLGAADIRDAGAGGADEKNARRATDSTRPGDEPQSRDRPDATSGGQRGRSKP